MNDQEPIIPAEPPADHSVEGDAEPIPPHLRQAVADLARRVLAEGLPPNCFLNVNFPALPREQVRGIQITRLGRRVYRDVLIRREDPKGRPYYWIGGEPPAGDPLPGTDIGALAAGYISVTPLNLDMTDEAQMRVLNGWNLRLPDGTV